MDDFAKYEKELPTGRKRTTSCLLYGCLFAFLGVVVLLVLAGVGGYWFVKNQVALYTSETPADIPVVEVSEEEVTEIEERVDAFTKTIEEGKEPEDLVLTAREINAMISKDENLRGKAYVAIDEGQVTGQLSIPADKFPGGAGRYFNASATFNVAFENETLTVTLSAATVNGKDVPDQFIEAMSRENLAKDLHNDPKIAETLSKFESVKVEDDKIILKPRRAAQTEGSVAVEMPAGEPALNSP